jgi:uncharacterized membrane protein
MTRILWIIGLSIALLVNTGVVVICCIGLVTHGHLNPMGWFSLIVSVCLVWLIYGWLRSAIKYGDPRGLSRRESD